MSTTLPTVSTEADSQKRDRLVGEQRIVLDGVSWDTYDRLVEEINNHGVRLTYDRGRLEIMAPSMPHEKYKRWFGRMIDVITEELNIPMNGGASTTFRRKELQRGLEPDECFWIKNASAVIGKTEIDFDVDPPPDLAIEVDITSSSVDKLGIYAALGVPEVWQFDGVSLRIATLENDGAYREVKSSLSLPNIPIDRLVEFLDHLDTMDETAWVKQFRSWVREQNNP